MKQVHKTKPFYLLFLFLLSFSITGTAQNMVSYAYDNAGNRISRKVVLLNSNPSHAKKIVEDPPPVVEQLGERKIAIYPNPTKGALAVEITGGNDKDELRIMVISAQGIQLQNLKAETGITPIDMQAYPPGWFILRVQAGDKVTEFKIIKQ
jgi:hypothetical protein